MSVETENSSEAVSLESILAAALNEKAAPESDSPQTPETAVTAEETSAPVSTATTAEIDPPKETIEAPAEMTAEQRAAFNALPPEMQRNVADRYGEVRKTLTQKTEEIARERDKYKDLETAFEPYRQELELRGVSPGQAARQLLAAQRVLERNPVEGFKWLAQSLQFDLGKLAPSKEDEFLDPTVKALREEIRNLQGQVQQIHVGAQVSRQSDAERMLTEFRSAKAEDGSPKHPHFEHQDVQAVMGSLVARGKSLADAYGEAIYVLPEVRSRIAEEAAKAAKAETEKKQEQARKEKLVAAKSASQTIRSRGTAEDKPSKSSLEDQLKAAMREASQS